MFYTKEINMWRSHFTQSCKAKNKPQTGDYFTLLCSFLAALREIL